MKKTNTNNNTEKINVTVDDVFAVFDTNRNGKPVKLNFSDAKSQSYCGTSDFSVNMKKSNFSVYMSTKNSQICTDIDSTLTVLDNFSDTTKKLLRCKLIRFTDFETLKKCIIAIMKQKTATE